METNEYNIIRNLLLDWKNGELSFVGIMKRIDKLENGEYFD